MKFIIGIWIDIAHYHSYPITSNHTQPIIIFANINKLKKQTNKNWEAIFVDGNSNVKHKIENFVSYEHIVADIKSLLKKGHIDLLETLGEKIVDLCFKDKRVQTINIKLEKLEVFKEAISVGIEIFRKKTSNNSVKENLSKAD